MQLYKGYRQTNTVHILWHVKSVTGRMVMLCHTSFGHMKAGSVQGVGPGEHLCARCEQKQRQQDKAKKAGPQKEV